MKKLLVCFFFLSCLALQAQVLEVPTLQTKGIEGKIKTVEWYQYGFVAEKGLVLNKKDLETYDDQGRLVSTATQNLKNNQLYKTVYQLSKKGLLEQIQIVNPNNNLALQTTSYVYKKGLLIKTTQVQGPNTVVKSYTYDKKDRLIQVEVQQNGTLSLTEYYVLNEGGLRTKISRKLAADTEAKVSSIFTYEEKDGKRTSIEHRFTEQGEFKISKLTDLETRRDLSETTQKVGTNQQGINRQLFLDDEQGNWIKGEVLDEQFGRAQMVLRKITYADGTVTGRGEMLFPDDYRAQYIRKYNQQQLAVNGKVEYASSPINLEYTTDRLTYVSGMNAWVLLKGYDDSSNMTKWGEGEIMAGGKEVVLWAASSGGIDVFHNGKELLRGTSQSGYSAHEVGGSFMAYVRGNLHQSFVAELPAKHAGKVIKAELSNIDYYWGKASDTTYVVTGYGKSVNLQDQLEDENGNKLAMQKLGGVYLWYGLPNFRKHFDEGEVGSVHPASNLLKPLEDIGTKFPFEADFSGFYYNKLKDRRYSLRSKNGVKITAIASQSARTPDDELIAYFPLTNQYLRMENYYKLEDGKEWENQKVTITLDSSAYAYYIYNEGQSIVFYSHGQRFSRFSFNSHKLNKQTAYGAVLYDSTSNVSYGMSYDTSVDKGLGSMRKLPVNSKRAYLLKLEGNRWVVFQGGQKLSDYTFSKSRNSNEVVHFYKDPKGRVGAFLFSGFDEIKPGGFIYASDLQDSEMKKLLIELRVDPALKKSEADDAPGRKASTYDKEGELFYLRDASGNYIQSDLAWFGNYGFGDHLIAYDSVARITYRLNDYYKGGDVVEKGIEILIGPSEAKALKTQKNNIFLFVKGEYQGDVSRVFMTQNAEDETWKEVFFDKSAEQSYLISYPADSSSYVLKAEPTPVSDDHTYIFRTNEENFIGIARGALIKNKSIRSRVLGDDLIRMVEEKGTKKGYLFKGYKKAPMMELIGAEIISSSQLTALWTKAGEALKKSEGN
ncbi:MAG: hypothetical protein HEP71_32500 [Roseivirga sp.]|nr:hypothetical protein [Roseivirga sp.]